MKNGDLVLERFLFAAYRLLVDALDGDELAAVLAVLREHHFRERASAQHKCTELLMYSYNSTTGSLIILTS